MITSLENLGIISELSMFALYLSECIECLLPITSVVLSTQCCCIVVSRALWVRVVQYEQEPFYSVSYIHRWIFRVHVLFTYPSILVNIWMKK